MAKGRPRIGRPIVIIDRYTKARMARYQSAREAAEDLSISKNTIYASLCSRIPVYESYFVYEDELYKWKPTEQRFWRVRGVKTNPKLEELRKRLTK